MNTSGKRLSKALACISTYATVLIVAIFINALLLNRESQACTPSIHTANKMSLVFTPNLDIAKSIHYNTKEVYVYLVHQIEKNGYTVEQVVWSTLAKKNKVRALKNREVAFSKDSSRPLTEGKFFLKGSYFPYIGLIKNKTFAEFSSA